MDSNSESEHETDKESQDLDDDPVEGEEEEYQCDICDSTFNFHRNLLSHKRRCHNGDIKCSMCTYTFKTNEEVATHVESGHITEMDSWTYGDHIQLSID